MSKNNLFKKGSEVTEKMEGIMKTFAQLQQSFNSIPNFLDSIKLHYSNHSTNLENVSIPVFLSKLKEGDTDNNTNRHDDFIKEVLKPATITSFQEAGAMQFYYDLSNSEGFGIAPVLSGGLEEFEV